PLGEEFLEVRTRGARRGARAPRSPRGRRGWDGRRRRPSTAALRVAPCHRTLAARERTQHARAALRAGPPRAVRRTPETNGRRPHHTAARTARGRSVARRAVPAAFPRAARRTESRSPG